MWNPLSHVGTLALPALPSDLISSRLIQDAVDPRWEGKWEGGGVA
jgi:hypothetical protein